VTRSFAPLIALSAVLLLAGTQAASASPSIDAKRAEARQVQSQLMTAQSKLEKQIEAYDAVHQRYVTTKAALHRNRQLLAVARSNLKQSQAQLAASLTSAYKNAGGNSVAYLLASDSFSDLLDHMQVLERTSSSTGDLVKVIDRYQHEVAGREKALAQETSSLHGQVQEMAARKAAIESQIAALHQREANISADIKQMIAAEQRRQDAAAAAAAAAASGGGGGSISIPAPPSSTLGGQAVAIAMQYLGTPYVWGGASPGGFDCSGFTMYVYAQLGVGLPHNAAAQYSMGTAVPRDALEPGDLVFFDGLGHVGIYVGGGAFIHSPHTGDVVRISPMSGWYSDTYVGARRIG